MRCETPSRLGVSGRGVWLFTVTRFHGVHHTNTPCVRSSNKGAVIATNQAGGLSASAHLNKAKALFAQEGAIGLMAWFTLWADYNSRDIRAISKWAVQFRASKHCTINNSAKTIELYVGAIDRAVKKYGSVSQAQKAHAKWLAGENGYEFGDISNFVKFAPAGQRAKQTTTTKQFVAEREAIKYTVKQLEQMLAFRKAALGDKYRR